MEEPCSQLGAGIDALDDDASQPLPGGEDALSSQPLDDSSRPASLEKLIAARMAWCDTLATPLIQLPVAHGSKVFLGRPGSAAAVSGYSSDGNA